MLEYKTQGAIFWPEMEFTSNIPSKMLFDEMETNPRTDFTHLPNWMANVALDSSNFYVQHLRLTWKVFVKDF